MSTLKIACLAVCSAAGLVAIGLAQSKVEEGPRVAAMPANRAPAAPVANSSDPAGEPARFRFILFWNENNPQTQQISQTLSVAATRQPGRFDWTSVNVRDAASQILVEQYQVSRAPMPLVVCVAPNGAITGAYVRQFNDAAVERSLVTPAMADVTKALQEKKIILLHIKPVAESPLPVGAVEFAAEPDFHARTTVIDLVLTDPAEKRFLTDMKVTPADVRESMVVVMAPPAVLVGKFAANVTKDQIAAQLHAAGKCCNDPNCKHNKGAQQ
jgi:hypothetical protein